jgi:hypothetical protein
MVKSGKLRSVVNTIALLLCVKRSRSFLAGKCVQNVNFPLALVPLHRHHHERPDVDPEKRVIPLATNLVGAPSGIVHSFDTLRRRSLVTAATLVWSSCFYRCPSDAAAFDGQSSSPSATLMNPPSADLPTGMLETRVTENLVNAPPYGMEGPDVAYPSWFSGLWTVESTTKDVLAPCGLALFGGNATYNKARLDIGNVLRYESRFLSSADSPTSCIADREYNVRSIAKAAMGANSVVDIPLATPNKMSAILAPLGSPSLLKVDLITLNRRQEIISDVRFDCSEVVREIVAPVGQSIPSSAASASILKEIETTSLYTYNPQTDMVACRQRSAAFLLPSQQNPMAMSMFQASRGRAVDVRFYDVNYTRR